MAVNTWAVSVTRYGAGIMKWNADELKSLYRRTRKFDNAWRATSQK